MDGQRFDDLARSIASGISRRRLLSAIGAGAIGALVERPAALARKCLPKRARCRKNDECCSGYCLGPRGKRVCTECKSAIVCDTICCPIDALAGCSEIQGPNGPVIGCLCPEETIYDRAANACVPCPTSCDVDEDCCTSKCCRGTCATNEILCCGVACGDICCPDDALNGCTEINGPNGPIIGCVCPNGTFYDNGKNECVDCPGSCVNDDDCCTEKCCDGVCCAAGDDRCCGGTCATTDTCLCPPGVKCSGTATCTSFGVTYDSGCCPYPLASVCCADSTPGAGDGFATCAAQSTIPGACANGAVLTIGGVHGAACYADQSIDCCKEDDGSGAGGDAVSEFNCIMNGYAVDADYPCCSTVSKAGVCICAPPGTDCSGIHLNSCCNGGGCIESGDAIVCP